MTIISGSPAEAPEILEGWKAIVVPTLRALVGDLEEEKYTNSRLIQSFLVCSNLVMFDVDFPEDYEVNIKDQIITPEPSSDFISLGCLKTACILITGEGKDASGCKVSMKDGPSAITMDKSDLVKVLQAMGKNACSKYEEAAFIFKQEGTLGVAIFGPHGIGAIQHYDTRRNFR